MSRSIDGEKKATDRASGSAARAGGPALVRARTGERAAAGGRGGADGGAGEGGRPALDGLVPCPLPGDFAWTWGGMGAAGRPPALLGCWDAAPRNALVDDSPPAVVASHKPMM